MKERNGDMNTMTQWMTVGLAVAVASTALAQRKASPVEQQAVQQGMDALMKALGGGEAAAPAALVDQRELRALLPADLPGMKRTSASAERSGAMGMTVSRAEGAFEDGKGATIGIEIVDLGGMGGLAAMAHAGWASAEIDRETDTGFERTTNYQGMKAMEEYDSTAKNGKMQALVGGRIMVIVQGSGVGFEAIRAAMDRIDLKKLAALKPVEPAK